MAKKIFRAFDNKNNKVEVSIMDNLYENIKIENLNNEENVIIPIPMAINMVIAILKHLREMAYTDSYIHGLKNTEVPENYALVMESFFGLPRGTLIEYNDNWLYLPISPYIISRRQFSNGEIIKYGEENK